MIDIGIMVEGQEDMTWSRWQTLAATVETLGFGSLFRSDHLTALDAANAHRSTLALWPSLTYLASQTSRIRFGPMVCSVTFRHPAMLAKMAASVSQLANGRLDLGIGAGWYAGEHTMFGISYPSYGTRLAMLDEAAQLIRALWSGQPTSFSGNHFSLTHAQNHPAPHAPANIIMGGKGTKTLQVVARHADEWNCSYVDVDTFMTKSQELSANATDHGRDPASIRRSIMIPFVIGKNPAQANTRISAHRNMFPNLPPDLAGWLAAGFIGGTPQQVVDQLGAFVDAGATRFMLQHNTVHDMDSLALLAESVLPAFDTSSP